MMDELYKEIFDLREEVIHLRATIKNDDEYLEVLSRAEDMPLHWRRMIQMKRDCTHGDLPEIFI